MENKQVLEVDKMVELEKLKNRYRNQVNEISSDIADWKHKYLGLDDDGRTVFIYPNAIKHHKSKDGKPPYWNDKSLDKSCQIFAEDSIKDYDTKKPFHIFEGEKDWTISVLQGISFSAGAGSIPEDISVIYEFGEIIIIYDNDETGRLGSEKLAKRIKTESPKTQVKIAQWDKSLPKGYDVCDDSQTGFAKCEDAIVNATEYTLPVKTKTKGFEIMNMKDFCEEHKDDNTNPIIKHYVGEKNITLLSGDVDVGKPWVTPRDYVLQLELLFLVHQ